MVKYFVRLWIFTMRNSIFLISMVNNHGLSREKWFKRQNGLREKEGDGFFYHDKRVISRLQW